MKNKFLVLMILGIVFITSCSDDDDKDSPKDFNGIYSTTSTERVLDLRYSDVVFIGKSVDFNSVDGKSATLKLQGVVPGESETVFSDVQLEENNSVYTFAAENKNDERTVALEGSIVKGKLTVDVDVKFVQSELMKTWDFSAVKMSWAPHDYPLTEVDLGFTKMKLTTGLLATMAPTMLAKELKNYLQNITFREDGNIVATYNTATATEENPEPEADWQTSPLNLAQYCVKEGVCYVFLSLDMIMRQVNMDQEGRSMGTDPILGAIEQLLTNGIPVHFEKTEGTNAKGALYVYLDEVLLKQLGPLLPLVEGFIPEDMAFEASFLGKTISVPVQSILENLPGALEVTTAMQVGLQFKEAE